jgi:hypothetical protein
VPVLRYGLHLIAPASFSDYFAPVNNKKHFFKTDTIAFVSGVMLLAALIEFAVSASGAPVAGGSAPNAPLQPGVAPQQTGTLPNNNTGNGTFVNGGNGTFIQPSSPAQPGSPVAGGQTIASNNVTGQNITSQNTNQSGAFGTRQQYNQQGWMTNRPPLQTNDSDLQGWMTNHPTLPMVNTNTPLQ